MADVVLGERLEEDDLVKAIEKFRTEMAAQFALNEIPRLFADLAVDADTFEQILAAEVRGHDQNGVLEINGAPLGIGDAPVVEDLQQHVEHVWMGFLNFVKKDDGIWLATHGFGELAAFFVADVSWRRADQTADGIFLHVLAHIDAHHVVFVVKKGFGEGFGQLCLTNASRTEEEEGADWFRWILDAGLGADDGIGDFFHGLVLADDALVQLFVEMEGFLTLALGQLGDRNASPTGNDRSDLVFVDGFMHELELAGFDLVFFFFELTLQLWQHAILQLAHFRQIALTLSQLDLAVDAGDLVTQLGWTLDGVLFVFPLGVQHLELVFVVGELLLDGFETLLAEGVFFLFQRHFVELQLQIAMLQLVDLFRLGILFGLDLGASLVDQVDGLVRQETIGDVAGGEGGGGDQRVVGDAHAMVGLVIFAQTTQDGDRFIDRRLVNHDTLETALQGGVLFDVLAVFVEGCGADAVQLAARQHWLQQVAGVHGAVGFAGADDEMQLIDEEDDAAFALFHLVQHRFQTFLKFAAIFRASDQRPHIQREDRFVLQRIWHIALDDTLCQPFDDSCFADARLADEHRIVLRFARKDTDHISDLVVAADDRIKLLIARPLHEIGAVFFQAIVGFLRAVCRHRLVAAHILEH